MTRDFTLRSYERLLSSLLENGYRFLTFEEYLEKGLEGKQVILRHDVDDLPENSHRTAIIEHQLGIKGVYYFRIVRQSNHPNVIRDIAALGHEIGYHYEDLALARGDMQKAIKKFEDNLNYFREYYLVKTICMHGSPRSRWDNRKVWEKYNYRDFGISGEPYLDLDFNKFAYLTDTGRTWNGALVSVRDKVSSPHQLNFARTDQIIENVKTLPDHLMITVHPQRWNDGLLLWTKELIFQNLKNLIKRIIIRQPAPPTA
ncbi:MAG: hypothetical protein KDD36_11155 [Flavobacteriales bacterium]|nr:hypothetical protein [Flavobacteriales bacterium]